MSTSRWDSIIAKPVLWPVLCEPTFTDFKSVTNLHCFVFQSIKIGFYGLSSFAWKNNIAEINWYKIYRLSWKEWNYTAHSNFVAELWIDRNRISTYSMIFSSNRCCLCKFIWKLFPHCYFDEPRDNELWMKTIFPCNWVLTWLTWALTSFSQNECIYS